MAEEKIGWEQWVLPVVFALLFAVTLFVMYKLEKP